MLATVKVYYDTGLTPTNSLDNSLKLESLGFNSQAFPDIAVLQDRGNVIIRLDTSWNLIKNADYCKINNTCFWITSIDMLNENVAQLQLQEDFITTVGINNIRIISGQCERRHVNDDTLLSNNIPEPFTPSSELVLDFGSNVIGYESESGTYNIVLSTVDFNQLDYTAQTYTDSVKNLDVVVPLLPLPNDTYTTYEMQLDSNTTKSTHIGATSAYAPNDTAIQQIRSLGIESAIIASYVVPQSYVSTTTTDGQYNTLTGKYKETISSLDIEYMSPTIKNKKVYSGQFQKYIIMSPCSGETKEYKPEEIFFEGGLTDFVIWCTTADPRFNGYPMCKPKKFYNTENSNWLTGIKGVQWQNSPISYNYASGYTLLLTNAMKNMTRQWRNNALQGISNIGNIAMGTQLPSRTYVNPNPTLPVSMQNPNSYGWQRTAGSINGQGISGITGIGSGVANSINTYYDTMQDIRQGFFTQPDLDFAEIPNLQDYIGNYFYEMRYRLSDSDTIRFDNFLTQFGYAVDEELTNDVFTGRQYFNYVKARSVDLKTNCSHYETMGVISALNNGVRIWHTAPSILAMKDNPRTGGN